MHEFDEFSSHAHLCSYYRRISAAVQNDTIGLGKDSAQNEMNKLD